MNVKSAKNKAQSNLDTKIKAFFEGERALLKKFGIARRLVVRFPRRPQGKAPLLSRILLKVVSWQGGILDTEYSINRK